MKNIIAIPLFIFYIYTAGAASYFVSNSGSNSNDGLSLATALLTLQHAADIAVAGDSIFVENGTYVGFDFRNENGTSANPIVFKTLGNNVLINQSGPIRDDGINIENADFIVIDGFIVNNMTGNGNGIRLVNADNCVVRNCSCDNNAERGIFTGFTDDILIENNVCTNSIDEHGIYVSNSSDRPIIRFNECYGNNNIGIHINGDLSAGGDGIISDAQIYGNIIHDNNLAAGINMDGVEHPIVFNNLIYNNHTAQGIALFQQDGAIVTHGAKIFNNTIIVPSDGRWGILLRNGANVDTEIYNNIIINQHAWRGCITVEATAGFTSNYNIVNDKMSASGDGSAITLAQWQALGFDLNSQLADDLVDIFENPAGNNYQLASGSQAIDMGTNLVSGIVTVDIIGTSRPIGTGYDVGAYEASSALPLELLHFELEMRSNEIRLEWSVLQSNKLLGFDIEHSTDGSYWESIGFEPVQEGIRGMVNYQYEHERPAEGLNFYRLKQTEWDGSYSFSDWKSIFFGNQNMAIVYPNPAGNTITIKGEHINYWIRVFDAEGRLVSENKNVESGQPIDVSNLRTGTYFISIDNGAGFFEKIIIEDK